MSSVSHILTPASLKQGQTHLAAQDTIMAGLIQRHGDCRLLEGNVDLFGNLVMAIISQQLSTKAADTIAKRVAEIAPGLTPPSILGATPEALRSKGLSQAKSRSLLELASAFQEGRLPLANLAGMDDQAVIDLLIKQRGIGLWTAQMFLIFSLKRADILSLGDAGLRRAHRLLYGTEADFETDAKSWSPYRSLASWYLWRHLDNAPPS